ncbi:MAG: HEAT repeat domain-containing protein [Ardenticatenaceae bacterium]|nr:HEAT repeat domain-containing protein [Anaerolineales bacterium]MCB8922512.1 HEAT repeat domain-containing protein [Ardenticatenaceae bacterium]MCB8989981.1 HEAT repeat domain-containing protein [Ardenticatenaceae bacterium]
MTVEEEIIHILKTHYEKMISLRGNRKEQEQENKKTNMFLKTTFQKNPQLILNLFWKSYKTWIQLPEQERHKSPRYSDKLLWTIIDTPTKEAIDTACQIMIESEDLYKETVARFLGDSKNPKAVPYLIEALKSDDYNVVSKSALALGDIGDSRAEPYLLEIVDKYNNDEVYSDGRIDDSYPIIRYNTFNALCLLNTPAARKKILQSLFHDRDIGIQQRAIRYLVAEMQMEAVPYLEKLSESNHEEIATLARNYLEKLDPNY